MVATNWDDVDFMGHKTRVPLEDMRDHPDYDQDVVKKLSEDEKAYYDEVGTERAESISRDGGPQRDEYRPRATVWHLYIPSEQKIISLAESCWSKPLCVKEWGGPTDGPYLRLAFNTVPDQTMPLAPLAAVYDLHGTANHLFHKLMRQAKRQKTVYAARADEQAVRDVNNLRDAADGHIVTMEDPSAVQNVTLPGPNAETFAFFLQTKQLFSYAGGNLDVVGGLAPGSDTATQDQMLQRAASSRVLSMQADVVEFAAAVARSIAWYQYTDPLLDEQIEEEMPGIGPVRRRVNYQNIRQSGEFFDYHIRVDPYSLQHKTPEQRLSVVMQFVQQIALPLAQQLMAQGAQIDLLKLVKLFADYSDVPQILDVVKVSAEQEMPAGGGQGPRQAPNTTRTNVRVNRPGATQQGADQVLQNALLGSRSQPSQAAALTRQVG
jgi:hypothetical protein